MIPFAALEKSASRVGLLERLSNMRGGLQNAMRISPAAAEAWSSHRMPIYTFPGGVKSIPKLKPEQVGNISPTLAKLLSAHGRDLHTRQLADVPRAWLDWDGPINRLDPKLKIQQANDSYVAQLLRAALRPEKAPLPGRILRLQELKKPSDYF